MPATVFPAQWLPLSLPLSVCVNPRRVFSIQTYMCFFYEERSQKVTEPRTWLDAALRRARLSLYSTYPLLPAMLEQYRRQPAARDERRHVSAGGCAVCVTSDLPTTAGSRAYQQSIRASNHQCASLEPFRHSRARGSPAPQPSDVPEDDRSGG